MRRRASGRAIAATVLVTAAVILGTQALRRVSVLKTLRTKGTPMATQRQDRSDSPLLNLIGRMTADSLEATQLDAQTVMLVRIAALVAVHAPPASYLLNLGAASEVGVDADQVRSVLLAIAPVVGTPAVTAATGNIARALGFALEMADMEAVPA